MGIQLIHSVDLIPHLFSFVICFVLRSGMLRVRAHTMSRRECRALLLDIDSDAQFGARFRAHKIRRIWDSAVALHRFLGYDADVYVSRLSGLHLSSCTLQLLVDLDERLDILFVEGLRIHTCEAYPDGIPSAMTLEFWRETRKFYGSSFNWILLH
jgi:hypothetical protein